MKKYKILLLSFLALTITFSCTDRDDSLNVPDDIKIHSFIWKGLNLYYLWQQDVPDLADNRFANQIDANDFYYSKGTPENLFQNLLNKPVSIFPVPNAVDRFSVLVNDYTILENLFQGVSTSTGVEYGLKFKTGSTTDIFGWVKYIIPNSDASTKNIVRGNIFYAVNGTQLTVDNYRSLLGTQSFTLNMADFNNGSITPNGQTVSLTKTALTENPVLFTQVYNVGVKKVGYLVYNGFTSNFEAQLNNAFTQFKVDGVTHFILDLRYNSGGSIRTATRLGSMITGQFGDQIFSQQQWNPKVQTFFEANNPNSLLEKYTTTIGNGSAISSLNMTKVVILTSDRTASASELVINCLKPYIQVYQIGDVTTGKNVGSITLYDSKNFSATDRNPAHRYAMQPMVLKTANKSGFSNYQGGITPNVLIKENLGNLSQLGNTSEPLLSIALGYIGSSNRIGLQQNFREFKDFTDSKSMKAFGNEMFLENLPIGFQEAIR
jgi:C-terminal processing protease CtpA/Prc